MPPEEPRAGSSAGPLFENVDQVANARARGHAAAQAAADKSEKLDSGWRERALEAVRAHAAQHEHFLAEDIHLQIPDGADGRGSGNIVQAAARMGICVKDGYAPARTSNGTPKVYWKSLVYQGMRKELGSVAGRDGRVA